MIPSEQHTIDFEKLSTKVNKALSAVFVTDTVQFIAFRERKPNCISYYKRKPDNQDWLYSHSFSFDSISRSDSINISPVYCFIASSDSIIVQRLDDVNLHYIMHKDRFYKFYEDTSDMRKILDLSVTYNTMIPLNDKIYAPIHYNTSLSKGYRYSLPHLGKFHIDTTGILQVDHEYGKLPEIYLNDYYYHEARHHPYLATDDHYLYATYAHDHNVYRYDDTVLIDVKEAKGNDVFEFEKGDYQ